MTSTSIAEKSDMSPSQLSKAATHIIVGSVENIFQRVETNAEWEVTNYLGEIRVNEIEKGKGLRKKGLLYVHYWTRSWVGKGIIQPSTNGYRGLPSKGETLRVYIALDAPDGFGTQMDGKYHVIGANGFERLK